MKNIYKEGRNGGEEPKIEEWGERWMKQQEEKQEMEEEVQGPVS